MSLGCPVPDVSKRVNHCPLRYVPNHMPRPDTRTGLVRIRCVDNDSYAEHLTIGKDYELLAWEDGLVRVIDDDGVGYLYDPARFAEILDDGTTGLRLEYPAEFFKNGIRSKYAGRLIELPPQLITPDPHDCAKEHGELPHWVTVRPVVTVERDRNHGMPSIRGTSMIAADLVDMVGQACFARTLEDLNHDLRTKYDLTYDDAGACVRYAADTVRAKRRAHDFVRGDYTEEQAEAELNKRIRAVDDGREKTIPWEEVKEHLRERFLDADEHLPAEEPTEWHMTTSGKFLLPEFEPVDVIGRALYWEDIAQQYERYVRRLAAALDTSENEQ